MVRVQRAAKLSDVHAERFVNLCETGIFGRNETLITYNADSSKNILTTCLKHICDPIRWPVK